MRTLVAKAALGTKSAPEQFVFGAFHTASQISTLPRLERRVNKLSDAKRMFLV